MGLSNWIINNDLELILIFGFSIGIYFLFQINLNIKSQKTSFGDNSSNNTIINLQDSTMTSNITDKFIAEKEGRTFNLPSQKENRIKDNNKLFIDIEQKLSENYSITSMCSICLRLAKNLKLKRWEKFFENELQGYEAIIKEDEKEKGIQSKDIDKETIHRSVPFQISIKFKNRPIDTFDLKMFLSVPIEKIENLSVGDPFEKLMMRAPPLSLMIETLNVNPNIDIPYIVQRGSLQEVIIGLKVKIREFLMEVDSKIN